jgi:hypothetical protein
MARTASSTATHHRARASVAGDVLRAFALLSVLLAAWQWGLVGAALFLLVLGGTLLPRAVAAPPALDVAYTASLLLAAYAAQLGWYDAVGWLDLAVHTLTTALVAVVVCLALARWSGIEPAGLGSRGAWVGAVLVAGTGAALAVLWEIGEWFGNAYLDPTIHVGYTDTVGDLAAGLAGSVVAGVLVARRWAR